MTIERFHIAVELAEAIGDYLNSEGWSGDAFFQQQGVNLESDYDNGYMDFELFSSLFEAAATFAEDEYIGLKVGRNFVARHWGRLGYLILSGENGLEGVQFIQRFAKIVTNAIQFRWATHDAILECEFEVGAGSGNPPVNYNNNRQVIDYLVSSSFSLSQASTGLDTRYKAIHFTHQGGSDPEIYERLLKAPCYFRQPANKILADLASLKLESATRDSRLKKILESHAQQVLQTLASADELVVKVQSYILDSLPYGVPSLKQISDRFALNERTFQRNLAKQGMHYQDMVDDLRRRMALEYIHNDFSFLDIAMMLGYSEQSAFHRAFKRWTGLPPSKYRRSHPEGE